MFKFFRRRSATARDQPGVEQSVESASPADLARLRLFASEFAVSGPFVDPDSDEHDLWQAGKLVPWYISHLLDNGRHSGPTVDIACHAEEPTVDLWEAGQAYPTWDQTIALAQLLDVRVRDLTHPDARPRHHPNRPQRRRRDLAILSFEPSAVHAATECRTIL
ncbi:MULTISPECIES: hypothetical protein [Rhodococcus]|uniref:Uncharacterized protein n=1 Tax=Rhodococcus opacus (strain B4) TaxID=632772 RepID=C1BCQ6_RHOOB|nr:MULTISPECIES: hypothetical protein [Rhodococcus]KAF0957482.1 hypothetical protein MLGJGCBP_09314 [Rhodococcus sp. T7]KAF0965039.1 hypothetical protein MLGJGCBP_01791 [Rhodococcus sp. T7]QQZ19170.1 hypothetical protein GO592_37610 [Rhodococcus sp. 21391]UOT07934.1 hypothetical protein MPY17_36660 [Rhodococcus opacus]BAH55650.1 hypothetical protein ROP_pROB01-01510 [Rhodococcus opacus B4]